MSFAQRKANYAYGINNYISKNTNLGWLKPKSLNDIMILFLKSINKPYIKWNYRYKGCNTPDLINSVEIQNNFELFIKWIKQTY